VQIVISNIEQFKAFFDVVSDVASELVELQLFPDRMTCSILDRSKTRFYHVNFDDEFFDNYIIDDVTSIVVFVDDFVKLLKSTNKKDTLYLEINDPYLIGKVESENGNSRIFEFVLPSDFVDSPAPPHIDLPAVFECEVGDLEQSVKDMDLIGSDLYRFIVNGNVLTLMPSEDISTKYANTIGIELENPLSEVVSCAISLEYVEQMLKFKKINKTIKLKLGNDMPLFYVFEDILMGVTISGMIAPRISEEEE
jgi:hypothetical protein